MFKAWTGPSAFWICEPMTRQGRKLTTLEDLHDYFRREDHIFILIYAGGDPSKPTGRALVTRFSVDTWEEHDWTELIEGLPDHKEGDKNGEASEAPPRDSSREGKSEDS